jgi:hypothetical protein
MFSKIERKTGKSLEMYKHFWKWLKERDKMIMKEKVGNWDRNEKITFLYYSWNLMDFIWENTL